jgi:CD36 family
MCLLLSQYRVKSDVVVSNNQNTVSYTQQQRYVFNARASAPLSEDDPITVLNMHVNVSSGQLGNYIRQISML